MEAWGVLEPLGDMTISHQLLARTARGLRQAGYLSAASRAYVPQSLWPDVKDRVVAMMREMKVGDVADFRTFMGAVIDHKAFAKITGYIDDARRHATIVQGGGASDERGFFVEPTLVETTDPQYRLMREEIFGPVVTTFVYPDARWEETLRLVDETSPYGLTGAVFAQDRSAIEQARFETGGRKDEEVVRCLWSDLRRAAEHCAAANLLAETWRAAHRALEWPRVMGVLNVTPDSFSDGGLYNAPEKARERALQMVEEGADILDIGGESSRPGASPISAAAEIERVAPVVESLAGCGVPISIDTCKAVVAEQALNAGASWVNDISAGRADPLMLPLVAERGCTYVAMHMQGEPGTMQADPRYEDPVAEVTEFLRESLFRCLAAGVSPDKVVVDPGIGFGKSLGHNLALLRRLPEILSLGRPMLLGVSRKSFIARVHQRLGDERRSAAAAQERLGGSAAATAACVLGGAEILRVHDVAVMVEAVRIAAAIDPRRGGGLD